MNVIRITPKEEEILQVLWNSNESLTAKQICESKDGLIMSTVQSTIRSLLSQELVKVEIVR